MKRKWVAAVAAVAVIGAGGAVAANTFGDGDGHALTQTRDFGLRPADPVAGDAGASALGKRAKGPRVRYFETDTFTVDPGADDSFSMRCPRRSRAITGYLATGNTGPVLDNTAVRRGNLRIWDFAVLNLNDTSVGYYTGIVCAKGL